MSKAQRSEPIPIFRSFESNGIKYIAGYAALFDSEDSYGTAMTREAVESSQEHLQSFPAVRFMHRVPFGQIDFENAVEFEGKTFKTFINDHGFHVLCRIYDECTNEWGMVKAGKWGFSYGFMPDQDGGVQTRKIANGHTVPAFVKGTFYEVSVVDAPSHSDAIAYVISRMIDGHKGTNEEPRPREIGFRGQVNAAFHINPTTETEEAKVETPPTSVFRSMINASSKGEGTPIHPVQRQNLAQIIQRQSLFSFEAQLPEICSEACPIARHCSSYPAQIGFTCVKRTKLNRSFIYKEEK